MMAAARNDGGEVVEISQPTNDGDGDLVVRLRQERRNYSDTFQMYDFLYMMTMSFSDGGDVILFVSRLVNIHGDALQKVFEIIFTTCLRNVNLQHLVETIWWKQILFNLMWSTQILSITCTLLGT